MGIFSWFRRIFRSRIGVAAFTVALMGTISAFPKPAEAFTQRTAKAVIALDKASGKAKSSGISEDMVSVLLAGKLNDLYESVKRDYEILMEKAEKDPESISIHDINNVLQGLNLMIDINHDLDAFTMQARLAKSVRAQALAEVKAKVPKSTKDLKKQRKNVGKVATKLVEAKKEKKSKIANEAKKKVGRVIKEFVVVKTFDSFSVGQGNMQAQIARQLGMKNTKQIRDLQVNRRRYRSIKRGQKIKVKANVPG